MGQAIHRLPRQVPCLFREGPNTLTRPTTFFDCEEKRYSSSYSAAGEESKHPEVGRRKLSFIGSHLCSNLCGVACRWLAKLRVPGK
jgi:hypothetical protein